MELENGRRRLHVSACNRDSIITIGISGLEVETEILSMLTSSPDSVDEDNCEMFKK